MGAGAEQQDQQHELSREGVPARVRRESPGGSGRGLVDVLEANIS